MLRLMTAGESHGEAVLAILEGLPAGLSVNELEINKDLSRRQQGYGRGGRMKIEADRVSFITGMYKGETIGSPLTLWIPNKDNSIDSMPAVTRPRPGHADLAGAAKYGVLDCRTILERSSARETAARVAAGAVCKVFLKRFGIDILGHVVQIGDIKCSTETKDIKSIRKLIEASELKCADINSEKAIKELIDKSGESGDSLGGIFEVICEGVPPGLGSHVQWDRKLDARLAAALMSIQAIKGVEIGAGFCSASLKGSEMHDPVQIGKGKFFRYIRPSNNAGGLEGGMSNGEDIILKAAMKPIPTMKKPLESVDLQTRTKEFACVERADVCAVPAASVVAEAVVGFELARVFLEKFGGDSVKETERNYSGYLESLKEF